jgi:hypothetical protein
MFDDALRECRADAGQPHQFCGRGSVEIDRLSLLRARRRKQQAAERGRKAEAQQKASGFCAAIACR